MEEVKTKITEKVISGFSSFFKEVPQIVGKPAEFFQSVENNEVAFVKASTFALVVSCLLVLLSIPSYNINGVNVNATFYVLDIVITWLLIAIVGAKFWVITKLFSGNGGFFKTISSFFYASAGLVFIKLAEIPTRVVRDTALIADVNSGSTYDDASKIILENNHLLVSELYVLLGYLLFTILVYNLIKSVHGFGRLRTILSSTLIMLMISQTVTWLQNPITKILLTAFQSNT